MSKPITGPNSIVKTTNLTGASLAIDGLPTAADVAELINDDLDPRVFAKKIAAALSEKPDLRSRVSELYLAHENSAVALAALLAIKLWDPKVAIEEATNLVMNPKTCVEAFVALHNLSPDAANKTLDKLITSPDPVLAALGKHIESVYASAAA